MEMDVEQDIRAPDLATLDLYCDRVASAVGPAFGARSSACGEADGRDLAHHLGRALQLTNILRDLDEDAAVGRLYLPREALEEPASPRAIRAAVLADPALAAPAPWSPRAPADISPHAGAIMAPLPAPRRLRRRG